MFETTLKPNFRKLTDYFTDLTEAKINEIEASDGVPVILEYMNEDDYYRVSDGLKSLLNKYSIDGHWDEILYLLLQKNEQMRVRYDAYWRNYEDDLTSREVAKFLLAYKTSNPRHDFHLSAKTMTGNLTIKDSAISRWIAELIYQNIEDQKFPFHLFGEKIIFNLLGEDFTSNPIISMERLQATANLKPQKPTKKIKKLYVELCLYLQVYLINRTERTAPANVLLTDAQANLFFEVLELLGYLDRDKVESEPKDYIHAMFRNNIN